eukprot:CAMPEP_0204192882 /NCGR_PEP_ID=MMETSP0361-20130328/61231_1 /ASSEMBLY_ACC=CAM_ASM_000343 /TAXON_ID=268821 /ORGANISM="Scrippsiella Hangoei, Strain SHTV-5" /LENGTH=576 /DNA_ID=CAMNT_0051154025 /DNA_START=70 /DNA_END=1797 /DNA_ORIENTATION=-
MEYEQAHAMSMNYDTAFVSTGSTLAEAGGGARGGTTRMSSVCRESIDPEVGSRNSILRSRRSSSTEDSDPEGCPEGVPEGCARRRSLKEWNYDTGRKEISPRDSRDSGESLLSTSEGGHAHGYVSHIDGFPGEEAVSGPGSEWELAPPTDSVDQMTLGRIGPSAHSLNQSPSGGDCDTLIVEALTEGVEASSERSSNPSNPSPRSRASRRSGSSNSSAGRFPHAPMSALVRRCTVPTAPRSKTKIEEVQMSIWRFLEHPDGSPVNRIFHTCWSLVITLSVCGAIAQSMSIEVGLRNGLRTVDTICTLMFAAELLLKLACCPHRCAFMKSVYTAIDFAVIFMGFVGMIESDHTSAPVVILMKTQAPILRLLKIARHSSGWRLLLISMERCREPLLIPLYLLVLMVTFTGSLMFWTEQNFGCKGDDCLQEDLAAFASIPHAMWFTVVTISSVGYGDVTPHTVPGKALASLQIVAGIAYMAMPLSIIGDQFGTVWRDRRRVLVLDKLRSSMGGKFDIESMRQIFDFYDDGNGEITFEKFDQIVVSLDLGLFGRDVRDIFGAIDVDGSGNISFTEFEEFV